MTSKEASEARASPEHIHTSKQSNVLFLKRLLNNSQLLLTERTTIYQNCRKKFISLFLRHSRSGDKGKIRRESHFIILPQEQRERGEGLLLIGTKGFSEYLNMNFEPLQTQQAKGQTILSHIYTLTWFSTEERERVGLCQRSISNKANFCGLFCLCRNRKTVFYSK